MAFAGPLSSFLTALFWFIPLVGILRQSTEIRTYLHIPFSLISILLIILFFHSENVSALANNGVQLAKQAQEVSIETALLTPPKEDGPVLVQAAFQLRNIEDIDNQAETFQFSGMLRLTWNDKRQAFDPAHEGGKVKIYQGNFQFNEVSPAWYPEVVLANVSNMFLQHGVVLRVHTDGTSTLTTMINAIAEVDLNMRRYPFDSQSLEIVFEIIGFNDNEVKFAVEPTEMDQLWKDVKVSQWTIKNIVASTGRLNTPSTDKKAASSTFTVSIEVERNSFFVVRLVVIPLGLIVALSWSVFWMARSSMGDRINVSFIGILTAVAYQIVIGDLLPHISYFTLMNGFVNLSLIIMCATVVVNLVVSSYEKQGRSDIGDIIDYRCRWIFPLVYFSLLILFAIIAYVFY